MFARLTPSLNTIQGMQISMFYVVSPVMALLCVMVGIMMFNPLLCWATPYYNFFVYFMATLPANLGFNVPVSEATNFNYLEKTLEEIQRSYNTSFACSLVAIVSGFKSTLKGKHIIELNNVISRLDAIDNKMQDFYQKYFVQSLKRNITEDCNVWRSANWTGLEILKMQSKCGEL
jgi:hypothetical protein